MRICVVHSYYSSRQPSGENVVVDSQVEALRQAGHEVALLAQRTDDRERRPLHQVQMARTVATGRGASPLQELIAFRPDVVHVHNLFPNFGTDWLRKWTGPLVATLHNFRPLCAAGTLYRDGASCTKCPDGKRWSGIRHACYRESRIATAPLAWQNRLGLQHHPVLERANALVFLTEPARDVYVGYGLDGDRAVIIPNFVDDRSVAPAPSTARWLYAGRLASEKGVGRLLSSWPSSQRLDIVGSGPLEARIQQAAADMPTVSFLGPLKHRELIERLPSYTGLIVPSVWLEGLPTIVLEALACGVPIITGSESSVASVVQEHDVGAVLEPHEWKPHVLQGVLDEVRTKGSAFRQRCSSVQREFYSPLPWLTRMNNTYTRVADRIGGVEV